jgi:hypothetical protein
MAASIVRGLRTEIKINLSAYSFPMADRYPGCLAWIGDMTAARRYNESNPLLRGAYA